jgi:hypothetical protein
LQSAVGSTITLKVLLARLVLTSIDATVFLG